MPVDLPPSAAIRLVPLAQLSASGAWQVELMHDRADSLLIWLTRGQGTVVLNGSRRGVGVHNLLVFPSRTAFALDLGRQAYGHALIVPSDSGMTLPDSQLHLRIRDVASQSELTALIEALGREQTSDQPFCQDAVAAYGDLISIWIRRHTPQTAETRVTASHRLMRRYCDRLVHHHASTDTMADHAQALGVTPTHLTRVCRAETGKTAAALLTERILHAARRYLIETDMTAKDIAQQLGFTSAPYFTRFIQQHTGQPPSALRQVRPGRT